MQKDAIILGGRGDPVGSTQLHLEGSRGSRRGGSPGGGGTELHLERDQEGHWKKKGGRYCRWWEQLGQQQRQGCSESEKAFPVGRGVSEKRESDPDRCLAT